MLDCLSLLLLLVPILPLHVNWNHLITARSTHSAAGTPLRFDAGDLAKPVVLDMVVPSSFCRRNESSGEPRVPLCSGGGEPLGGEDGRSEEGGGAGVVSGVDGRA